MKTAKKAIDIELGDKVDIGNGLKYEVVNVSENKNGKITFILYPYQNSMSARKKVTLSENKSVVMV